jgi:hypothetical protein
MRITLSAILRAMFGAHGSQFVRLQQLLPSAAALGSMLSTTRCRNGIEAAAVRGAASTTFSGNTT